MAYNMSFEKECLLQMAELLPERREALLDIAARMVDLLPVPRISASRQARRAALAAAMRPRYVRASAVRAVARWRRADLDAAHLPRFAAVQWR